MFAGYFITYKRILKKLNMLRAPMPCDASYATVGDVDHRFRQLRRT